MNFEAKVAALRSCSPIERAQIAAGLVEFVVELQGDSDALHLGVVGAADVLEGSAAAAAASAVFVAEAAVVAETIGFVAAEKC